ncbi:MAG TPA: VOC family protein [Saprospiraceae bacterium]|nr:VOC family protein [Saprospiraceae bacterium]
MKINSLTLFTPFLQETLRFYHELLGFNLVEQTNHSFGLKVGQSLLRFEAIETGRPHYHFAFSIPKNNVREAGLWLEQRTPLIPNEAASTLIHFANWKAHAMYFYDPQGNIVEFIAREDLDATSDAPFSATSVLGLNEIGIVVDAPLEWARYFMTQAPVPFFSRGPVTDTFTALGDDEGLLIISHPGRNWFPTQIAAEKHPLRAELITGNQHFSLNFER